MTRALTYNDLLASIRNMTPAQRARPVLANTVEGYVYVAYGVQCDTDCGHWNFLINVNTEDDNGSVYMRGEVEFCSKD